MKTKAIAITHSNVTSMNRTTSTFFFAVAIYLIFSTAAMAACFPGNPLTPMGEVLCEVVWFMYGNLGRGIATLGIIVIGVGALLGKVSWGMALTIGVGISIIFNAEEITSLLICGNANETICFPP